MPVDPYLLKQFVLIQDVPSFEVAFTNPGMTQRFFQFMANPAPWTMPDTVVAVDKAVDGPHGPIPVRVYRPIEDSAAARPGLLWMHGGGFVAGSIDMNESHMVSAELAARAGAVVVSVDYRLAVGGVKYPVPLDDVVASWEWLAENVESLGVDPARISIGGASAGGNLATSAAMRLRDSGAEVPNSMLLAYPLVHFPVPALEPEVVAELQALPPMLHFTVRGHEGNLLNHLGRITDVPAGIAPGNFALEGMPPAFVVPCEYDELRPSGELFARQLESVGITVEVQLAEGMVHGHLDRNPSLPAVDRTLDFFSDALSR